MSAQRFLPEQGLLETREQWQKVLKFFGEDELIVKMDGMWALQNRDGYADVNERRWEELQQEIAKIVKVLPTNLPALMGQQGYVLQVIAQKVETRSISRAEQAYSSFSGKE